jgi:hypothetical protein
MARHLLLANLATRRVVGRPAAIADGAEFRFGMNMGTRTALLARKAVRVTGKAAPPGQTPGPVVIPSRVDDPAHKRR